MLTFYKNTLYETPQASPISLMKKSVLGFFISDWQKRGFANPPKYCAIFNRSALRAPALPRSVLCITLSRLAISDFPFYTACAHSRQYSFALSCSRRILRFQHQHMSAKILCGHAGLLLQRLSHSYKKDSARMGKVSVMEAL